MNLIDQVILYVKECPIECFLIFLFVWFIITIILPDDADK